MLVNNAVSEAAKTVVSPQVIHELADFAELSAGYRGNQYFDKWLQYEIRYPFGQHLVGTADLFRPAFPELGFNDEDSARGLAFMCGGIALFSAIEAVNNKRAGFIRRHRDVAREMSLSAGDPYQVYDLGQTMLNATSSEEEIASIEAYLEQFSDESLYLFRIGVGWTIHRAVISNAQQALSGAEECKPKRGLLR